jgi:group I intron endonuclease
MDETKCGIYKIISPTNRVYIGQAVDIYHRWNIYKKLDCKTQQRLYNSLKKYGFEKHTFEIVELCEIEHLNIFERKWQDFYNVTGIKGLNCKLTKTKDKSGKLSEETKKRMSKYWKDAYANGKKHPCTGIKLTEEHKQKIKEARKKQVIVRSQESIKKRLETIKKNGGYKHSEETKKKISENTNITEEHRQRISETHTGKFVSDETRKKISNANKGNSHSEETKQKIREYQKGRKRGKYKKHGKK